MGHERHSHGHLHGGPGVQATTGLHYWQNRLLYGEDTGAAASEEQRAKVDRAARREYQVLQGINHRGRTSTQSPHTGLCAAIPQ
ncbi:hypothetical protein [Streptomyces sp. NPDC005784]|uniref:hypothetical protein n=1 Tax=Streptomyces sp. NPDC005784 TaxID=3364731 RepID=UPI00368908D8